jgi:hypothetical protein
MRFPAGNSLLVVFVTSLSTIILVGSFSRVPPSDYPQIALFIMLIIVASSLVIRDPAGGALTSTGTLFYTIIYLFDPATAFVIASVGHTIGLTLTRGWVTWRTFFNGSQIGLSVAFAALVYRLLGGDPSSQVLAPQILPTLLGPLAHQTANNFFVSLFFSMVRGVPFLKNWLSFMREVMWTNLLGIPTAILITILSLRIHFLMALTFLLALPLQRWAVSLYLQKRGVYSSIVDSLIRAAEFSQAGSSGHARRVADLSVAIGRELGLTERYIESVEFAGLLHDVGMIGLEDLEGSREASNWITAHTRMGFEIVSELPRPEIAEMVLHHHVPYELRGSVDHPQSIGARVISLAEDVDSRLYGLYPYPEPQPLAAVVRLVSEQKDHMFDPAVADAFLRIVGEGVLAEASERNSISAGSVALGSTDK